MPEAAQREFVIPFAQRDWQKPLIARFKAGVRHGVVIAHRRAGKDRGAMRVELRKMLTEPMECWHGLPEQEQARKVVWDVITGQGERLIDVAFPPPLRKRTINDEMKIEFVNGSLWRLVGMDRINALMGGNPKHVTYSEFALTNPKARQLIRPILAENGGSELIITTPRGYNHAWDVLQLAKSNEDSWYWGYHPASQTGLISAETLAEERRDMPDELYRQEYECFKPDALVMCADRVRPIAAVSVGDVVLTHTGRFRRVDRVHVKAYCGPMLRVESYGARDIECTPEHPLYVCDPETQTYSWKRACDVAVNDWLVTPRMDAGQKPIISPALAKIIAWYACEGCVSGNALTFSIGMHESDNVRDLCAALGSEGYAPTETHAHGVTTVQVNAVGLADFLVSQCGSLARNKRLPLALLRGNEALVWDTLMRGDGCISVSDGRTPTHTYASVSEGLIQQVQVIGSALGYRGSYSVRDVADSLLVNGRTISGGVAYSLQMRDASRYAARFTDRTRRVKNGTIGRVFAITQTHYGGQVHNLEVAGDHSYVVNGRAVHNCDFSAANVGAILGSRIEAAEREGRVSAEVTWDSDMPVVLSSDIGFRDAAAFWFWQPRPDGFALIDYREESGLDADDWLEVLKSDYDYDYAQVWLPHDAKAKTFATKRSPIERFRSAGLNVRLTPFVSISHRINAARMMMPKCRFNAVKCARGLKVLRSWSFKWDDERRVFSSEPLHDEFSNGADAYSYGALVMNTPEVQPKKAPLPLVAAQSFSLEQLHGDRERGEL